MEDPKQYVEELEERVIDLKVEVVQLSAMLACAEVREKALRDKLAALQHTGQAMAMVEHEYEDNPVWDAESPIYAAGIKALRGKR